jgi:hypothetical protein
LYCFFFIESSVLQQRAKTTSSSATLVIPDEAGIQKDWIRVKPGMTTLREFRLTLILHKFPLNGHGQAVQKGFQANLQATRHGPFIPELEFTEGGILPFQQIFRPTALGSLEEGLAHARLCN